jgi:hypothetical protein
MTTIATRLVRVEQAAPPECAVCSGTRFTSDIWGDPPVQSGPCTACGCWVAVVPFTIDLAGTQGAADVDAL